MAEATGTLDVRSNGARDAGTDVGLDGALDASNHADDAAPDRLKDAGVAAPTQPLESGGCHIATFRRQRGGGWALSLLACSGLARRLLARAVGRRRGRRPIDPVSQ